MTEDPFVEYREIVSALKQKVLAYEEQLEDYEEALIRAAKFNSPTAIAILKKYEVEY